MSSFSLLTAALLLAVVLIGGANAQLSATFYDTTCPNVTAVVRSVLEQAQQTDPRIGAKLIRVQFHDCMVDGCDASLLLDAAAGLETEKDTIPNASLDGFNVLDDIKTALENVCPGVVSCADILAIAAQISVSLTGGQAWNLQFGRRDSRTTNRAATLTDIPSPFDNISVITGQFTSKGLDTTDLVVLSGAHTIGKAQCVTFAQRINASNPDPSVDPTFLQSLQQQCPDGSGTTLVDLDVTTPNDFDNNYYTNLQNNRGLLATDQVLFSLAGSDTVPLVNRFAGSQSDFLTAFGQSMINLANVGVLTGNNGEIRTNCRRLN